MSGKIIIGCDEVGYGSVAGSVVVCGVRAAAGWTLEGLNDSKKLSEKKRNLMRSKLEKDADNGIISFHIAERSSKIIDELGIAVALKDAYAECFKILDYNFDDNCQIIVDGNMKFNNINPEDHDIKSIVKADTKIPTVMAASILAKTYRDGIMKELHKQFPMYDWDKNVGYGTYLHLEGLKNYGPCHLHRFSYAPVNKYVKQK